MNDIWVDHYAKNDNPLPDLARAFLEIPPPPCEALNCANYQTCEESQLACEAFARYISKGAVADTVHTRESMSNPTRNIFLRIYPTE